MTLRGILGIAGAALTTSLFALAGCNATSGEDGQDEDSAARDEGLKVCAAGTTVKGVDVSFYQGDVNWTKVKNAGLQFAIARVSDGVTYPDDKFQQNWAGIKAAGLVRGAYQFFRPGQNATSQANLVVGAIGKLGDGDLPAIIDVETADGQSSATIVSRVKTWLDVVEQGTGKKPIIYAASGFWDTLSGTSSFAGYDLWVANYGVNCPYLPATWSGWKMWQYTDAGSVSGISGGVDTNYFNGTAADLWAYASKPVAITAMDLSWKRNADGSYSFQSTAPAGVTQVKYTVDDYPIGAVTKAQSATFTDTYSFSVSKLERRVVARGLDAGNKEIAHAIGLLDVTPDVGVFIRQTGTKEYEIGLERAPVGVATLEVRADGYLLVDGVSGKSKTSRLAVKSAFTTLGERDFALTTYNADGTKRGTLHRVFTIE